MFFPKEIITQLNTDDIRPFLETINIDVVNNVMRRNVTKLKLTIDIPVESDEFREINKEINKINISGLYFKLRDLDIELESLDENIVHYQKIKEKI